ncbi:MAG TPA: DUF3175 domain-containing protein [Rhizomicrobium sp.]|nr:DUF3175 domain-containing protein [Rhizomicrobium sp.]
MPAKTSRTKASRKSVPRKSARKTSRKWSGRVTRESDALDLKGGVFNLRDPKKIAASLKSSAEHSTRRKAEPFRSALSMLTFYINRGGKNLPAARKRILEQAKTELRRAFGRA